MKTGRKPTATVGDTRIYFVMGLPSIGKFATTHTVMNYHESDECDHSWVDVACSNCSKYIGLYTIRTEDYTRGKVSCACYKGHNLYKKLTGKIAKVLEIMPEPIDRYAKLSKKNWVEDNFFSVATVGSWIKFRPNELFTPKEFKGVKSVTLTCTGYDDNEKIKYRKYNFHCPVCQVNYPETCGNFGLTRDALFTGQWPCLCYGQVSDPKYIEKKIGLLAKSRKHTVRGYKSESDRIYNYPIDCFDNEGGEVSFTKLYLLLTCKKKHKWDTTIVSSYTTRDMDCPECAIEKNKNTPEQDRKVLLKYNYDKDIEVGRNEDGTNYFICKKCIDHPLHRAGLRDRKVTITNLVKQKGALACLCGMKSFSMLEWECIIKDKLNMIGFTFIGWAEDVNESNFSISKSNFSYLCLQGHINKKIWYNFKNPERKPCSKCEINYWKQEPSYTQQGVDYDDGFDSFLYLTLLVRSDGVAILKVGRTGTENSPSDLHYEDGQCLGYKAITQRVNKILYNINRYSRNKEEELIFKSFPLIGIKHRVKKEVLALEGAVKNLDFIKNNTGITAYMKKCSTEATVYNHSYANQIVTLIESSYLFQKGEVWTNNDLLKSLVKDTRTSDNFIYLFQNGEFEK